jgi:hypothetical protein
MTEDYELKVKLHAETMNDIEAVKQREHLSDEYLIPYLLARDRLLVQDLVNIKEIERIKQRDRMNDIELMHYLLGLDKLLEMDGMNKLERRRQIDKAWMIWEKSYE